jgi:SRSO17 transposase
MWRDIVRAAARRLPGFVEGFAACFARPASRAHALTYVSGLLQAEGRKSIEPMALRFAPRHSEEAVGTKEVLAMQRFITDSPWEAQAVQRQIQKLVAEGLFLSASASPLGVVGVIDESSFEKSGPHSVGVKRQYCGHLGKTENCQVGVFLVGTVPAGEALLDHQLYLPKEWINDRNLRKKARVPREVRFQTKPQIAAELIRRTVAHGHVRFDWIVADDHYGENGGFLDALEAAQQRYMVETPITTTFWLVDPATQVPPDGNGPGRPRSQPSREQVRSARDIVATLPANAWQPIKLREGAKGPLVFEYAALRVWAVRHRRPGPPVWLVLQRSVDSPTEVKVWVSNADESTPLEILAQAGATRFRVELFFEEAKGELGMGHYEARAWTSWHHHMALVAMAHLFATLVRQECKADQKQLTLRQSFDLIRAALDRPPQNYDQSLQLTEYYITRNATATKSHRKTWLQNHKRLAQQLML